MLKLHPTFMSRNKEFYTPEKKTKKKKYNTLIINNKKNLEKTTKEMENFYIPLSSCLLSNEELEIEIINNNKNKNKNENKLKTEIENENNFEIPLSKCLLDNEKLPIYLAKETQKDKPTIKVKNTKSLKRKEIEENLNKGLNETNFYQSTRIKKVKMQNYEAAKSTKAPVTIECKKVNKKVNCAKLILKSRKKRKVIIKNNFVECDIVIYMDDLENSNFKRKDNPLDNESIHKKLKFK